MITVDTIYRDPKSLGDKTETPSKADEHTISWVSFYATNTSGY